MESTTKSTTRVSIFTPTHDPSYLLELYATIKDQPFYEWVIVANGKELKKKIYKSGQFEKNEILTGRALGLPETDDRIRIIWFDGPAFVGALKNFACSNCTGDVLLEVDHDDLLTDDAIIEVQAAFDSDPEVGFVYSNSANFRRNFEKTERYQAGNGWRYRPFMYKGHELDEVVTFEETPTMMSRIWFCPNHLRAWRKTVYDEIGGHNKGMRVLDDQELISRTYIATKTLLIDKCLYLYRIIDRDPNGIAKNTWLIHNQEIQENVMPIHSRFIQDIATVWCQRNGLKALDLGGRFHKKPGIISVDLKDAEVNCDLTESWPFEDNSVGLVVADDLIEHLPDTIHFMKELHRVLCDGGVALIMVPSTDGRGAFQDPTHVKFFNENSFWYYTRSDQARFIDTPVRFQEIYLRTFFPNDWAKNNNIPYVQCHMAAIKSDTMRRSGRITI